MSDRRRNAFVLALVAGLVILSLLVTAGIPGAVKPRKTQLGLDLQGGVELIFQGRATGGSKVNASTISQAISIIESRVNSLGVSNATVTSSGQNQIDVSLACEKNVAQAENAVGSTGQLYFFDWEQSVLGAGCKVGGPNNPSVTGDSATNGGGNPGTSLNALTEYQAIQRALACPVKHFKLMSAPYGTVYYVDPKTQKVLTPAGELVPEPGNQTAIKVAEGYLKLDYSQTGRKLPSDVKLIYVRPGTVVRQALTPNDGSDPSYNFYYVMRDDPSISGKDVTNPVASTDPTSGLEVVSFGFRGGAATTFQNVTAAIAQRGQQTSIGTNYNFQHFAIVLDKRLVTVPYIDFTKNPTGIDATSGSEISGSFTVATANQLANLLASGALPINLVVISSQQVSATLGHQALN